MTCFNRLRRLVLMIRSRSALLREIEDLQQEIHKLRAEVGVLYEEVDNLAYLSLMGDSGPKTGEGDEG